MPDPIPHIVQYQGSKRKLAPHILSFMPPRFNRLVEPFAGMAAVTIACAYHHRTNAFWLNDKNAPLMALLQQAIEAPDELLAAYSTLWQEQFDYPEGHVAHYVHVRDKFNEGEQTAANMLYLLARCVKGSVRYGRNGQFNQYLDKRRHGTNPNTLKTNIYAISGLLRGHVLFSATDYREILSQTVPGDLVYLDPPYQGVCEQRDSRYISGIRFEDFVESLYVLRNKGIDFIVSYDGSCGSKTYGQDLPEELGCKKILVNAGVSTQSVLLGQPQKTFEAIYISHLLSRNFTQIIHQATLWEEVS